MGHSIHGNDDEEEDEEEEEDGMGEKGEGEYTQIL
jgi:hypothetical protein